MALPSGGANVGFYLTGGSLYVFPGVDAAGRLIYWANATPGGGGGTVARAAGTPPESGVAPIRPLPPDSPLLVALSFQSRTIDTVGSFKVPSSPAGPGAPAPPPIPVLMVGGSHPRSCSRSSEGRTIPSIGSAATTARHRRRVFHMIGSISRQRQATDG